MLRLAFRRFSTRTLHHNQVNSCLKFKDRNIFGTRLENGKFEWMTYGTFGDQVDRTRTVFLNSGLKSGERVACISNNRAEWAIAAYAAYSIGAHFVPMYEVMAPSDKEYILQDSQAKFVVAPSQKFLDESIKGSIALNIRQTLAFDSTWKTALSNVNQILPPQPPKPSEIATIIYTSGTTGRPKGVMLNHSNFENQLEIMNDILNGKYDENEVHASIIPWSHVFGQSVELHNSIYNGASIGITGGAKTLLVDMKEIKPTMLIAVPQLYNKIYDGLQANRAGMSALSGQVFDWAMGIAAKRRNSLNSGSDGSFVLQLQWKIACSLVFDKVRDRFGGNLKYCFTGGAALNKVVQEYFDDMGIPVIEGYGLTETSPIILCERLAPTEYLQGGLKPGKNINVYILDPSSTDELPNGKEGEICCAGGNVMVGYLGDVAKTNETIFVNDKNERVLRTGDMGMMNPDGSVSITGRVKELYKLTNGKYVVPTQIEGKIKLSPLISHLMLFGQDKPYNVLILVPDHTQLCKKLNISPDSKKLSELIKDQNVIKIIHDEINLKLADEEHKYMIPKKLVVTDLEWSVDNNLLTPKLSVKRKEVIKKFASEIEASYK